QALVVVEAEAVIGRVEGLAGRAREDVGEGSRLRLKDATREEPGDVGHVVHELRPEAVADGADLAEGVWEEELAPADHEEARAFAGEEMLDLVEVDVVALLVEGDGEDAR